MNLALSGTPGTGKTTLAKKLGEHFNLTVINEKDFALQNKLGKFNEENELEIPISEFQKKANAYLKKHANTLFEGHVLCEAKLKVDAVILLTINPEELEMRLEKRPYSMEKKMDNVFCEGIEYCKKQLEKNYPKEKIVEIKSQNRPETTFNLTLSELLKLNLSKTQK